MRKTIPKQICNYKKWTKSSHLKNLKESVLICVDSAAYSPVKHVSVKAKYFFLY